MTSRLKVHINRNENPGYAYDMK